MLCRGARGREREGERESDELFCFFLLSLTHSRAPSRENNFYTSRSIILSPEQRASSRGAFSLFRVRDARAGFIGRDDRLIVSFFLFYVFPAAKRASDFFSFSAYSRARRCSSENYSFKISDDDDARRQAWAPFDDG